MLNFFTVHESIAMKLYYIAQTVTGLAQSFLREEALSFKTNLFKSSLPPQ